MGTPGNEPEECARDFAKAWYYYYPCGVYWYDASNELLLETSIKISHEVCWYMYMSAVTTSIHNVTMCDVIILDPYSLWSYDLIWQNKPYMHLVVIPTISNIQ